MLEPHQLLHIYNQGNNRQPIFFNEENYHFFLEKVKHFVSPAADILAYCLMPNHFHFLVYTNHSSCKVVKVGSLQLQTLSNAFRNLQSSYAQAINKQHKRNGSLFRQRTKMKVLLDSTQSIMCLHYIHQNPLKARLVTKMENWKHSSFAEYCEPKNNLLCNLSLSEELLRFNKSSFYEDSYKEIGDEVVVDLL